MDAEVPRERSITEVGLIPGEIVVRLSPKGASFSAASSVPFAKDVTRGVLPPLKDVETLDLQNFFSRYSLPLLSVARPLLTAHYNALGRPAQLSAEDFSESERKVGISNLYVLHTERRADPSVLASLCQDLVKSEWVESAHLRYPQRTFVQPTELKYLQQWGLWRIKCEDAWEIATGDPSVVVAVIDSGVDSKHPDLQPNLIQGSDQVTANVQNLVLDPRWAFNPQPVRSGGNNTEDDDGHGTHVAGIIGARGNTGKGVAGVAWNCKLLPVRCLARIENLSHGQHYSTGHPDDIANAIIWAANQSVRVINLSLGGPGDWDPIKGTFSGDLAQEAAVRYAVSRGCLVVAATGNEGSRLPSFPASFPDAMGVGAVECEDHRAFFSNWDRKSVEPPESLDVVAPGVDILSTYPGSEFRFISGTSQAAPHVSSVAALLFSHYSKLSWKEAAQIICDTADRVASAGQWHSYYGYGRINALQALKEVEKVKAAAAS